MNGPGVGAAIAVLTWAAYSLLGAAHMAGAESQPEPSAPWVARVNGEEVSLRLFERRLLRNRSAAYRHFAQQYGVSDGPDFWTTRHDGVTPLEWLRERTLEDCVLIVIQQSLARQHGVAGDTRYPAFLRALEAENQRRREALARGEPIYGPQQYGEDEYFTYLFANTVIELKRRLWEGQLHASDGTLRQRYEREKEKLYSRGDRIATLSVGVRFGAATTLAREEARDLTEAIRSRLAPCETVESVRAIAGEDAAVQEVFFDDQSARNDDRMRPLARAEAMKLSPGEVSPVFEERGGFWVLRCLAREPLGFVPFEEVKDNVRSRHVDEEYDRLIGELVSKAVVEVNKSAYNATKVR